LKVELGYRQRIRINATIARWDWGGACADILLTLSPELARDLVKAVLEVIADLEEKEEVKK